MTIERKSLRLTDSEISQINIALNDRIRNLDSQINTSREICVLSDATKKDHARLQELYNRYWELKELNSLLYGIRD
jgi:hypothetical protein